MTKNKRSLAQKKRRKRERALKIHNEMQMNCFVSAIQQLMSISRQYPKTRRIFKSMQKNLAKMAEGIISQ